MSYREISEFKWLALTLFIIALLLKVWISISDIFGISLIGGGLAIFVYSLILDIRCVERPRVIWDEERGIVATIHRWRVEVCAARLLGSVPLGIDLSHSARKVLQAMHSRYQNEEGGTLVFFISRPIGDGMTKVGMLVRRSAVRVPDTVAKVDNLTKLLVADVMILESAMRAAYPHLPVERAEKQDILTVNTGGIESSVPA
ncbi:MAG: hypothetical protein ACW98U_13340 [Candidatus Thorarchaeota archaeon]|jgi:hypothetical protein